MRIITIFPCNKTFMSPFAQGKLFQAKSISINKNKIDRSICILFKLAVTITLILLFQMPSAKS